MWRGTLIRARFPSSEQKAGATLAYYGNTSTATCCANSRDQLQEQAYIKIVVIWDSYWNGALPPVSDLLGLLPWCESLRLRLNISLVPVQIGNTLKLPEIVLNLSL